MGITWGLFEKQANLPLVITIYVQHSRMKDASHCKRNHQMKYSGCSCGCNGEWRTLQERKKMKEKTTPNSFKGQMRIQVCSWKPNPEGHQQGVWEFSIWFLHFTADPFLCKATTRKPWPEYQRDREDPDPELKFTFASFLISWLRDNPYKCSSSDDLELVLCLLPLFFLFLFFSFHPSLAWKTRDACYDNGLSHRTS